MLSLEVLLRFETKGGVDLGEVLVVDAPLQPALDLDLDYYKLLPDLHPAVDFVVESDVETTYLDSFLAYLLKGGRSGD